jgi:hypothetical protein
MEAGIRPSPILDKNGRLSRMRVRHPQNRRPLYRGCICSGADTRGPPPILLNIRYPVECRVEIRMHACAADMLRPTPLARREDCRY